MSGSNVKRHQKRKKERKKEGKKGHTNTTTTADLRLLEYLADLEFNGPINTFKVMRVIRSLRS